MEIVPINLAEANEFVRNFHRHNKPTQGGKFAIGLSTETGLCGVVIVGRPIARLIQDDFTAEVLRLCVKDDSPRNSCSKLYASSWRASKAMGYRKLITYTLQSESGESLRGAGFKIVAQTKHSGKGWMNRPNRDWQPVYGQLKFRWEMVA